MASPAWRVTVRRPDGTRGPQIRDYLSLQLDARLMRAGGAAGTLQVDVPAGHRAASALTEDGAGLILEVLPATGRVEWSGDIVDVQRTTGVQGRWSVIAEDDDGLLADDVAVPVPGTDLAAGTSTLFSSSVDARTGPAETVWLALVAANIGPSASVGRRRYSWLTLPTSAGRGATVTSAARMDTLLDLAQQLLIPPAVGLPFGLACRVVHADPGGMAVQVWAPTRPPRARYRGAANLRDLTWRKTAPRADEWIVGGAGDGSARLFTRQTDARGARRRRRVRFLDASSSGTAAAALADVAADIAEGSATEQATWQLVPTGVGAQFGVGLHVGDVAEVVLPWRPETPIRDVVRRVELTHDDPTKAPKTVVTVGWPDPDPDQVPTARLAADVDAIVRS